MFKPWNFGLNIQEQSMVHAKTRVKYFLLVKELKFWRNASVYWFLGRMLRFRSCHLNPFPMKIGLATEQGYMKTFNMVLQLVVNVMVNLSNLDSNFWLRKPWRSFLGWGGSKFS